MTQKTSDLLHFIEHGTPGGVPLVIAHGLFGSARNWGVIAKRLSDTRHVIAVDMRNHGSSFHSDDQTYPALADDLARVIDHFGGQADLLGHSMGGKASMHTAVADNGVRKLIVADIAPVAYTHTQQHLIDAMMSVDLDQVTKRSDANAQLEPLVDDPTIRSFLLQSLSLTDKTWKLNLTALSDHMSKVVGFAPLQGSFDGPALFLAGATSDYIQPYHRPTIKQHFPKARFAKIPKAGHWLHAENPRAFEAAVRVFLDAT